MFARFTSDQLGADPWIDPMTPLEAPWTYHKLSLIYSPKLLAAIRLAVEWIRSNVKCNDWITRLEPWDHIISTKLDGTFLTLTLAMHFKSTVSKSVKWPHLAAISNTRDDLIRAHRFYETVRVAFI
jgi:hypothetical protein